MSFAPAYRARRTAAGHLAARPLALAAFLTFAAVGASPVFAQSSAEATGTAGTTGSASPSMPQHPRRSRPPR
ncbi:hypothetical protein [Pandoraea captiosa]|uniref:hypothetical protein n=1 Tax=Pandoraea captiosa TaxID=2508302 RepID=UPI001FEAF241|nr:hypothetical protein [Pandoraea captiosa]